MNDSSKQGEIYYESEIRTDKLKSSAASAEGIVKNSVNKSKRDVTSSSAEMSRSLEGVTGTLATIGAGYVSLRGLSTILSTSVQQANKYEAAILGLQSVSANFTGETREATAAAQDLAADGLMSVTDSATGLKNLLATGFSLPEAINLMNAFKNSASFGRQGALEFGESIRGATEGIKNGNSILVDNAGVTKNLSVILKEAGKSEQDVMNITSDSTVRRALYNGILKETNAQMGDVAKFTRTAAGEDARLNAQMNIMQVMIGRVSNGLRKGLVGSLADFSTAHAQSIITVGSGIVAFGLFAAGAYGAAKAIAVLRVGLTLLSKHPAIAVISLMAAVLAAMGVSQLLSDVEEVGSMTPDIANDMKDFTNNTAEASKEASDLAKQLAKIDDQAQKARDDFREQLAELVADKNKSIKDLKGQLSSEQAEYKKAYNDRLYEYNKTQQDEETEHANKTKALQTQIDFLSRYNNAANQRRLSELQFALAKENSQYDTKHAERKTKYDQDAEAERLSYEKRRAELAVQLDSETQLLEKHRGDVASIRDVILLDEIQKLKRTRDEQLKSLEQQRKDAIKGNNAIGASGGQAFSDAYLSKLEGMNTKATGTAKGKSFMQGMVDEVSKAKWVQKAQNNFQSNWEANGGDFWKPMKDSLKDALKFAKPGLKIISGAGFSTGGYTGRGGVNEVAGAVHKGEYVLPQSMVNQSTGLPDAAALAGMIGKSGGNTTNNYHISLSGVMTSSPAEERALAQRLSDRLSEINRAKGIA